MTVTPLRLRRTTDRCIASISDSLRQWARFLTFTHSRWPERYELGRVLATTRWSPCSHTPAYRARPSANVSEVARPGASKPRLTSKSRRSSNGYWRASQPMSSRRSIFQTLAVLTRQFARLRIVPPAAATHPSAANEWRWVGERGSRVPRVEGEWKGRAFPRTGGRCCSGQGKSSTVSPSGRLSRRCERRRCLHPGPARDAGCDLS
jgi:hypothetical protein